MESAKKLLIALSIVVVVSFIAPAIAVGQGLDESNWPVRTTFASPVRIGTMVLEPGTYYLQLTSGTVSRNVVAIYSVDQKRWLGMVMGINDTRKDLYSRSGFTFENIGDDAPAALQYWFYPGWSRGVKFVYHSSKPINTMAEARVASSK